VIFCVWNSVVTIVDKCYFTRFLLILELIGRHNAGVNFYGLFISTITRCVKKIIKP